jgi:hypothetical protein
VVPYVLGGAHGDVWVGLRGWRARAIGVTLALPSFVTPAGFNDARTTTFELEIDRFFGPGADVFRGPWVAAGGGLSILTISASDGSAHGSATAAELSAGVGWTIALPLNLYVDPWAGATYQFTPSAIEVGTQEWRPARLGPVFGMKVGWNVTL